MLVSAELSVVKARAGSGGRSIRKRLVNSAAICCASAALPPLPKSSSLLPRRKAATTASTALIKTSRLSRRKACLTRILSANACSMISFMVRAKKSQVIFLPQPPGSVKLPAIKVRNRSDDGLLLRRCQLGIERQRQDLRRRALRLRKGPFLVTEKAEASL